MTLKRTLTAYCQNCIRITNTLSLETINEKYYWICEKCTNPLPRDSYNIRILKGWGDTIYQKKGTRNS